MVEILNISRLFSTLAGLAMAASVSGSQVLHLLNTILVNSLIVLHLDYRYYSSPPPGL